MWFQSLSIFYTYLFYKWVGAGHFHRQRNSWNKRWRKIHNFTENCIQLRNLDYVNTWTKTSAIPSGELEAFHTAERYRALHTVTVYHWVWCQIFPWGNLCSSRGFTLMVKWSPSTLKAAYRDKQQSRVSYQMGLLSRIIFHGDTLPLVKWHFSSFHTASVLLSSPNTHTSSDARSTSCSERIWANSTADFGQLGSQCRWEQAARTPGDYTQHWTASSTVTSSQCLSSLGILRAPAAQSHDVSVPQTRELHGCLTQLIPCCANKS